MRKYWPILRFLTFIVVGIFNTVLIRPEDVGSLKNYIGFLLLLLAAVDMIYFFYKQIRT